MSFKNAFIPAKVSGATNGMRSSGSVNPYEKSACLSPGLNSRTYEYGMLAVPKAQSDDPPLFISISFKIIFKE